MSWMLHVASPTGTAKHTITNGVRSDTGLVALERIVSVTVDPPGEPRELRFTGRADRAGINARDILRLELDGSDVFWGPAVIVPNASSMGAGPLTPDQSAAELFSAVGGRLLLSESIVGPLLIEEEVDVAAAALAFADAYAHPALTVTGTNFETTGYSLQTYYAPTLPLNQAFEKLLATVTGGGAHWVDAVGAIHFQATTPLEE